MLDTTLDRIWFFDFEVMKEEWIMCIENYRTGEKQCFYNDFDEVISFIYLNKPILVGYNNKYYDNYILRGVLRGYSPEEIKGINDFIIIDKRKGWEYRYVGKQIIPMPDTIDLMMDMGPTPLRLKEVAGNLGLDILESAVPFDLPRKMTPDELTELIRYCYKDVSVLPVLWKARKEYLEIKCYLADCIGIDEAKALSYTNATLTAMFLEAEAHTYNDELDYKIPDNILLEYIPDEVLNYIYDYQKGKLHLSKYANEAETDEDVLDSDTAKGKLKFDLHGVPHTIGLGGLHGAVPNYFEVSERGRIIVNVDVNSYYPTLMLAYHYLSRSMGVGYEGYRGVLSTRLEYKLAGEKTIANALKLVLNTTFGATLNDKNPLYDPLNGVSICLTGQLLLIELINMLYEKVPSIRLIQSNTDGIMFSIREVELSKVENVVKYWETKNYLTMEYDYIDKVAQKDVNNYLIVEQGGKLKVKGGYLNTYPEGDFKHNSYKIVAKAIVEYFVNGTPVEDTINSSTDIMDFQFITKTGSTFDYTCRTYLD